MADQELSQEDIDRINGLAKSVGQGPVVHGPLAPSDPSMLPQVIGQGVQRGLGQIEGVLGKARAATSRGMIPSFVPENSSLRSVADLINPVPGTLPQAAGMAASLPLGGGMITGPLKRAVFGGLASGGTAAAMGRDPLTEGGIFAGSQLAGELPAAGLRLGANRRAASKAMGGYEDALANREGQIKFNKGMHEAITGAEQQGFKQSLADQKSGYKSDVLAAKTAHGSEMQKYSEEGAKSIADAFKSQVPAWADLPSDTKGLLDMVYGKGQSLLSERYDQSLKNVIAQGRGQEIPINPKDALKLGLKPSKFAEVADEKGIKYAFADAGDIAEKMTGRWKSDPDLYRRMASALDRAGVGDPIARGEYKAAQGLISFADKSKMLAGEQFNPEAAQKAFTSLKIVDELRRRGQGNIFEGPLSNAVRQGKPGPLQLPPEPTPLEPPGPRIPPAEPAMPQKPDIKTRAINHPWALGAGAVELPLMAMGHHGYGMPAVMGGMLGQMAIPKELVTRAPISQGTEMGLRMTPAELGQIIRNLVMNQGQQKGPLEQ